MKKSFLIKALGIFLVLAITFSLVDGASLQQKMKNGTIDWGEQVVQAKGIGTGKNYAVKCRVAKVDAMRNLTEIIYGVQVDSETTVNNFVLESDVIKTKVTGFIQGAEVVSEKELSDGSCEVVIAIGMVGEKGLAEVIVKPAAEKEKKNLEEKGTTTVTKTKETKTTTTTTTTTTKSKTFTEQKVITLPTPPEKPAVGSYTGLIIDASSVNAQPAMSPKVVSERGDIIYGVLNIDPDEAVEKGIVGYADSLAQAKQSWRAGDNPLVVKATGTAGALSADVLVTPQDAELILKANEKAGFLNNLRVTIIL